MNKKQFFAMPDGLKNEQLWGFSWLEHVTAIPQPLALVTGYKENSMANATMQSWFCFSNENDFYCIFASVNRYTHMYDIAVRKKQLVINFPGMDAVDRCMDTIKNNDYDIDELSAVGLSYSAGSKVDAPVVDDCFLNLECEVMWEKELFPESCYVALCVKVVNAWFDEEHYNLEKSGRYGETGYLYNIHSPMNPETLESVRSCIGIMNKTDKTL